MEAQRTTFAFQRPQSTISTRTAFSTEDWYMALSTNCRLTLLTKIYKTKMRLVPSAMSTHVAQCWWCPLGMTVHLNGPRSIMDIWWLLTTPTKTKKNSSVLIEIRSSSLALRQTRMTPCRCTLSKAHAEEICRVVHMFQVESWLALCSPSERKTGLHFISTRALEKRNAVYLRK